MANESLRKYVHITRDSLPGKRLSARFADLPEALQEFGLIEISNNEEIKVGYP